MTSNMHWVFQILMTILHGINLFGGVVPVKYQPFVAFTMVIVQGGLGLYNHYFTPAGARIMTAILLFLILCSSSFAQTNVAPPVQHFSLSGSIISYMGPTGAAPSSIADGSFNITSRVALGYQQITIPTIATARLGTITYTLPLNALAGKTLTKKFTFDANKINVTFLAGGGKLNQTTLNNNVAAETGGVYISYPIGGNVSLKLVGAQWLHGGIVNGFLATGLPGTTQSSTAVISSGISVSF